MKQRYAHTEEKRAIYIRIKIATPGVAKLWRECSLERLDDKAVNKLARGMGILWH